MYRRETFILVTMIALSRAFDIRIDINKDYKIEGVTFKGLKKATVDHSRYDNEEKATYKKVYDNLVYLREIRNPTMFILAKQLFYLKLSPNNGDLRPLSLNGKQVNQQYFESNAPIIYPLSTIPANVVLKSGELVIEHSGIPQEGKIKTYIIDNLGSKADSSKTSKTKTKPVIPLVLIIFKDGEVKLCYKDFGAQIQSKLNALNIDIDKRDKATINLQRNARKKAEDSVNRDKDKIHELSRYLKFENQTKKVDAENFLKAYGEDAVNECLSKKPTQRILL